MQALSTQIELVRNIEQVNPVRKVLYSLNGVR